MPRCLALAPFQLYLSGVDQAFPDASLLLIGHGSTSNADSASPARQHAAELRRRGIFAQVLEAFLKQEPSPRAALDSLKTPRVFIVPLFVSEGYFSTEIIPRQLGLRTGDALEFAPIQRLNGRTLYYCAPVGTHESMTRVILARAREVVEQYPFPRVPTSRETALFIAGHGTDRNENSRRSIERQARLVADMDIYAEVRAVFMEEEPRIADCYELARVRNIVVVPFFISDGLHAYEDIPVLLGEPERVVRERLARGLPTWRNPTEKHGKRVWYARSIGTEPHVADVILERVHEVISTAQASGVAPDQGADFNLG